MGVKERAGVGEVMATLALTPVDLLEDTADTGAPQDDAPALALPSRYRDEGLLGVGGMGVVRRVLDLELNRRVAMKVMHPRLANRPKLIARFVEEAQATAQLQHPGIVPVHELGCLPGGELYFTMQEIRGETLRDRLLAGWSLRRLVTAFKAACDAMAYAHVRGVVHRDLKPDNILLGDHGEVLVVDWGLARVLGRGAPQGGLAGTPAYMAPEQAAVEDDRIGPPSDVYALGCVLYELLYGVRAYPEPDTTAVLAAVRSNAFREPPTSEVPAELEAIWRRALQLDPGDRFRDARELARSVEAWLDGVRKLERARELVGSAEERLGRAAELHARSERVAQRAQQALELLPPWSPEETKAPLWDELTLAEELEEDAILEQIEGEKLADAALLELPSLPEAHLALAELWQERHRRAEARHQAAMVLRAEARLRHHAHRLPETSPARRRLLAYAEGQGRLSLATSVPATARLYRYVERRRRLVRELVEELGPCPLVQRPLPRGSYLVELHAEGRPLVRYPVALDRLEHWEGGEVRMPERLAPDEVLVPAGPFWAGGDPAAVGSIPRERVHVEDFVIRRFPVSNADYILFLNDLSEQGRSEEALRHAPRERAATVGELGALIYGRDERGHFFAQTDADGDLWQDHDPVVMIDWHGAQAYADWLAASTGQPWRLPTSHEWGKAARGVDGRHYPWGQGFDPTWCCMRDSFPPELREISSVDSFPVDESPYGVRGLAGNVRDWCADSQPGTTRRFNRGGFWLGSAREARLADRHEHDPDHRARVLGFRVARDPR